MNLKRRSAFWFDNPRPWMLVVFAAAVLALPWILTNLSWIGIANRPEDIGATVGGIATPFLAGLAAWLAYAAFRQQYDANNQIRQESSIRWLYDSITRLQPTLEQIVNAATSEMGRPNEAVHPAWVSQLMLNWAHQIGQVNFVMGELYNYFELHASPDSIVPLGSWCVDMAQFNVLKPTRDVVNKHRNASESWNRNDAEMNALAAIERCQEQVNRLNDHVEKLRGKLPTQSLTTAVSNPPSA